MMPTVDDLREGEEIDDMRFLSFFKSTEDERRRIGGSGVPLPITAVNGRGIAQQPGDSSSFPFTGIISQCFDTPQASVFNSSPRSLASALSHETDLQFPLELSGNQASRASTFSSAAAASRIFRGFTDVSSQHGMDAHDSDALRSWENHVGGNFAFNLEGLSDFYGGTAISFPGRSKLLTPSPENNNLGEHPCPPFQNPAKNSGDHSAELWEIQIPHLLVSGDSAVKDTDSTGDGGSFSVVVGAGSDLNYDSEEAVADENSRHGGNNSSSITDGGQKGKKRGVPAKNLMAERRRRKKLNDRLYMLRSVVPKISKMDRASILGDAIDYLKELLQKIKSLHMEMESPTPPVPSNLYQPGPVKEESSFPRLDHNNNQPARIEVNVRERRAVSIHMLCDRKPGLLLSAMRALDGLGLDVQQAVISCFNGFVMDIFRAESKEGQDIHPEHVKAVLLDSAGICNL